MIALHGRTRRFLLALLLVICLPLHYPAFAADKRNITVYVTVDWEGWSLDDENIEAMQAFRNKFPHIPMMQLLNPVYAVRPAANKADIKQRIDSVLRPGDSIGLHIHGWKSLAERCGVTYQSAPSYDRGGEVCDGGECGYTVSLEYAYSQEDLTRLVACSANLLQEQGFPHPRYFRAGGWQLGPKLTAALADSGFTLDSSRIDATLLLTGWAENSGLVRMVRKLHPDATPLDQPYPLTADLMEYPNNGALADYTSTQTLLELFQKLLANGKQVMVIGFHQETAYQYLSRLEDAIPLIQGIAEKAGAELRWASYKTEKPVE